MEDDLFTEGNFHAENPSMTMRQNGIKLVSCFSFDGESVG